MAPLKRLRKASDKSTEATTVTEAAATKKRSREVEESSNALQTANLGYSSAKFTEASAKLAREPLLYTDTPRPKVSRRIIPEGAGDIAHLTVISNLQVALKVIYNKLQKGIDQFEASIFGDFTRMKTIQFCGGFVHHLLLRQLYNDDPHVIEFEFNGVGARFDRKAFAMFTGLNCGKFPKETEMRNLSYSLWTKYFGESGPMTQTEFTRLENIEFKCDNDQEIWDNVKSCMFFFLETVLLPADRSRLVKKNNFTIIENDNLLEKYPWGNLCYDLTISSLRSKMEAGKHKTSYSLYGFPLAFQMWGFHVIPMVPTMTSLSVGYPRMLGYQLPNILHYNRLANDVFNKKQEECEKTYMINFGKPDDKQYVGHRLYMYHPLMPEP
ncbi:hypothetical protein FNV43_RR15394 [Rhamnella rubrinervis]|uniref:DUF1985 domain-containing protein n=1 Tax=Rhamnella rubrinervis TaxID=2594499 RepID=A0A8K0E8Z3_9ROSA|nr:hypothetical protein FNV43_RR15394 [Rhamnella rubrinervis]